MAHGRHESTEDVKQFGRNAVHFSSILSYFNIYSSPLQSSPQDVKMKDELSNLFNFVYVHRETILIQTIRADVEFSPESMVLLETTTYH